jgi:hypothetical protein
MRSRSSGRNANLLTALIFVAACQSPVKNAPPVTGIEADLAYLASPALRGRQPGSAGGDSAALFIARRYEALGLRGPFPAPCAGAPDCSAAFFQFFNVGSGVAQNVAALIPGTDSALLGEYVVIGAHYDHLGRSTVRALDPELGPLLRLGADDNASGTAAVLELARRFASRPGRRTVLVANFDAEEVGLVGSGVFVANTPIPIKSIVLMLNLDMVGRLRDERLYAEVPGHKTATRELINGLAAGAGLRAEYTSAMRGRSDHATFLSAGVDAVALSTGIHVDYHKVSDKLAFINVPGLEKVVDIAEGIARTEADR